jgi:transglutaminase-like putative cysteine protease
MSYSEIASVLIDDGLERKYETYDTVSIDKSIIKMDFSSEYDSLSYEKSDKQISTVSTRALVPNVVVTGASCDWRWVQNTIVGNQITLHNYGTTTANGVVVLRSEDEMLGWATSYSNLAPGGDIVISLPFYVNPVDFPTVGAKPIRILAYVQVDSLYYLTSAPTISTPMIEMYNNNAGYLVDPDGGRSLEMDDLNHQNMYDVARRAAVAGDDTSTPYQTAAAILATVSTSMTYDLNALDPLYTGADIWVINNNYVGICDEYAVLYGSYLRALGIPTRRIGAFFTVGEISSAHQFNEFWDGSTWVHADASGPLFSNPRYYADNRGWNIYAIMAAYGADDSLSDLDGPGNDYILHGFDDMEFWVPAGLVNRYC